MNPVRFFEAFDLMSMAQIRLQACNTLLLSAFGVWRVSGTASALRAVMLKKNEKPTAQAAPELKSGASGLIRVITAADFAAEVLASKQPVLVAFSTSWSRACEVLESVLQELAGDSATQFSVLNVDADATLDLSLWYDIQAVPTLIYFVDGKPCSRIVGTASKEAILEKLNSISDEAAHDSPHLPRHPGGAP